MPRRLLLHSCLLLILLTTALPRTTPSGLAQEACTFVLGFESLHARIPDAVGTCLEDEQHDPNTGDAQQRTTGGLLVWRKANNQIAFTDGTTTWISGPDDLVATVSAPPPGVAPPVPTGKAWGIAWSGLEYEYNPPRPELDLTPAGVKFFTDRGVKLFRLAINWSVLQPTLNGPLSGPALDRVKRNVQAAAAADAQVVLDLHNYARYRGNLIGSSAVPNAAFADFWRRMAAEFKDNPGVWAYGLMNEPHDTGGLWTKPNGAAQAGIDGVRAVDQQTLILVAGDSWSGATSFDDEPNRSFRVHDPANHFAIEAHRYFDRGGGGKYRDPTVAGNGASPDQAAADIRVWTTWLSQTGYQGWLGEFGVPAVGGTNAEWMPILERVYQELDAHPNVIGGSLWVTGGRDHGDANSWQWNGSMALPLGAADNAHWQVLRKYPTGAR